MIRLIEVKDQDITMGDRGCSDSCAIALALRNEYGQDVGCEVRLEDNLEIYVGTKSCRFKSGNI